MKSNYDKNPTIKVSGFETDAFSGYDDIIKQVLEWLSKAEGQRTVVCVDCYAGVRDNEVLPQFIHGLEPAMVINTLDYKKSEVEVQKMIHRNLTEDRVFGVLSCHQLIEFFDLDKLKTLRHKLSQTSGLILIYGVGSSLISRPDLLVYADLARWEIQQRYRSGELGNWGIDNLEEDTLLKYKRAFFVEWRVIDRHKKALFDKIHYLLDTNLQDQPKMITGAAFRAGLKAAAHRPFRVVPFFDPAPWGGQWMKENFNLDQNKDNFGWGFDCVPEENSLLLSYGKVSVEVPSINLVLRHPVELLGEQVHARFGTEFPIRFDFLDTIGGGHLSFQVHPLTEYIQETFGMHYTQDESYYVLDAVKTATVYLGVQEGVRPDEMLHALQQAQEDKDKAFDADKFTNQFPAKKHDHFLIPAGTTHCSGAGSMVLEVSATPYIFTFKLWDWGRLGLDGKPRPVHLEHGKNVIQWDLNAKWVEENLINRIEAVASGEGWREERTGLHEREFIETRRHWFTKSVAHHTHGTVNVLNLIEGCEVIVESPNRAFEPYIIHYAETFIIPASVGAYTISPYGRSIGQKCGTLKAYVRGTQNDCSN